MFSKQQLDYRIAAGRRFILLRSLTGTCTVQRTLDINGLKVVYSNWWSFLILFPCKSESKFRFAGITHWRTRHSIPASTQPGCMEFASFSCASSVHLWILQFKNVHGLPSLYCESVSDCPLWQVDISSRVFPALYYKSPGISNRIPATLQRIGGTEDGRIIGKRNKTHEDMML